MLLYASGIIFFTFFYTSITFNPTETADNLRKYGGFVPGIKPPYFLKLSAVSVGLNVIDV